MAHVEINRIERLAQMPFRIVVEAAAVKLAVAVNDRSFDVVEHPGVSLNATL